MFPAYDAVRVDLVANGLPLDHVRLSHDELSWEPPNLTGKERVILSLLAERRGTVVTTQDILERLYGDDLTEWPDARLADVLVLKLGKKLLEADSPMMVHPVAGGGYGLRKRPKPPG